MKSLITRFASIGTIFSLVLAALSATALAQIPLVVPPAATSVHTHRGVVALGTGSALVAKVTAVCSGGTGTVKVTVTQMAADSSVDGTATSLSIGTYSSPVKCDNTPRTIAVHLPLDTNKGPNLGAGTATATLTVTNGAAMSITSETNEPVQIVFPVGEQHEEEQGGNE
jgi:hypothetical protein